MCHTITLSPPCQGARWDINTGAIAESKLKELHPAMPIIFIKAVTQDISDKMETRSLYDTPVYKTRQRGQDQGVNVLLSWCTGPTYIWTFSLKTKSKASKWVLAGVGLLLQI